MLNRRLMIFITLLALTVGALWWFWQNPNGMSLQAGESLTSTTRFTQDLNGVWDRFSSLRQAWTTESERANGKTNQSFLTKGRSLTLPSSERVTVMAKRFQIPGEWSSRTMRLTLNGVQGHAVVYLNGIEQIQNVGEFEGSGGTDRLEIPAKAFRYGKDNILMIELSASASQRAMLLGSAWPESGRITGNISLEAVVDTTIAPPELTVSWQENTATITVRTHLEHHGFFSDGPWTVSGVLSDGSAGVGEQTLTVQPQENTYEPVTLSFNIPDARRWSSQTPFLYQLHLTVSNGKGDRDDVALSLGLRSLAFASGKWVINGQPLTIHGEALTPEQETQLRHNGQVEQWLTAEQKIGINLIYFIGQLPDELWLQTADRVGIGLWVELPMELIPSHRLPSTEVFQQSIAEKMRHPSLWAWTVGKGLAADAKAQNVLRQAAKDVQPDLAFALVTSPAVPTGLPADQSLLVQGNRLEGTWGQVQVETPLTVSPRWMKEPVVAGIWALIMLVFAWMSIRAVTWRYKEIGEKKPKRRLRNAWFWHGLFFLAREGMLAGLLTSGLYRLPIHVNPWFSHLWPGIELLQAQPPWLIWAVLTVLFILMRLLQVGVVAPHLPESPHPLGLIYWLERRYRWAVFIAMAWALFPWGISWSVPVLGYGVLVSLFLPIRIRDIRRIGGRYRSFLLVPGMIVSVIVVWIAIHWADALYLWDLLRTKG